MDQAEQGMGKAKVVSLVLVLVGAAGGVAVVGYVRHTKPTSPEPEAIQAHQGVPGTDANEAGFNESAPLGSVFGINRPAPPPIALRVGRLPGEGDGPDLSTPASAVYSVLRLLDEDVTGELASCFVDGTESLWSHLYPGLIGHPVGLVEVIEESDSARVVWEATVVTTFSRGGREWTAGETIQLTARLVQVEGLWRLVTLHEGEEGSTERDQAPTVQDETSRTLSFPHKQWMGTLSLKARAGYARARTDGREPPYRHPVRPCGSRL